MDDTQKQALAAAVDALGLTYTATFVPQSKSRNKGEKHPSLNWRVKLSKGAYTLETDYMQGIAHVPGYIQSRLAWHADALRDMAEKGKSPNRTHTYENCTGWNSSLLWKAIPAPALTDILYCLVQDADVINYGTFEEWAGNFGYETDSRSAEATYRTCLELALKLRAMLGDAALSKLGELFQDY
jgi:hypothetical protein